MSRASDIEELITSSESSYSQTWTDDLMEWLADREDTELVEILRGCASTLAYRMVTKEIDPGTPSKEVFVTALDRVAILFKDNVKGLLKNDGN
jgi:hypothetical protein